MISDAQILADAIYCVAAAIKGLSVTVGIWAFLFFVGKSMSK